MEIKILGTRGEIKPTTPYHSHHSGVLLDDFILFDCGEREFLEYNPEYIFLTHLHPDHAFFARHPKETVQINAKIYGPEISEDHVTVTKLTEPKQIKDYHITPIPTHHSLLVKSQAYLIEKKGKRILYTGDMIWINKQYNPLLENLDLVITEASYIRKGGMVRQDKTTHQIFGHNGIPDLIHLFKAFTNHILFVHFGSWFYNDIQGARKKFQELAQENSIKITVGYDGLKLNLREEINGSDKPSNYT